MPKNNFKSELRSLINIHSIENGSDTPDYLLAEYLIACLKVYEGVVTKRDMWYNFKPWKDSTDD